MKTLAMMKMEKNFVAQEKGYPRKPYEKLTFSDLFLRLDEEMAELFNAVFTHEIENAKKECADVSNIVDYIFERLQNENV